MATDLPLLIKRLKDRERSFKFSSPEMKKAMTAIGSILMGQTVLNIRQQKLVDRGHLMNSISFKLFNNKGVDGVMVGSFGIPYAAIHEFGFKGLVQVREHLRRGVNVMAHGRNVNVPARPYLRPAVTKHRDLIINIIRAAVKI
jgi:phage gpG-like protein